MPCARPTLRRAPIRWVMAGDASLLMKKLISTILFAGLLGASACQQSATLDYDQLIPLDAEYLAEQGILETYQSIEPALLKHVGTAADVIEVTNNETGSYSVKSQDTTYDIYSPSLPDDEGQSWGRATVAFFSIINDQLETSETKFYALYSANDLSGIFLTRQEFEAISNSSVPARETPYIPRLDHPWYGQHH